MKSKHQIKCQDIILIHGLYQNNLIMKPLGNRLAALGYRLHYFNYPTLQKNLSDNTAALSDYLETFQHPYTIIAHSLGCILTFNTLKVHPSAQLQAVIAISPPFHGSRIVDYLAEHHSAFLVGKAKSALLPNQKARYWNLPIPLGIIAGTQNSGPTAFLLENLTNTITKDTLVGDGTVYLDETILEGYTDLTTLPKSHTMILFDSQLPLLCDHFIRQHHF